MVLVTFPVCTFDVLGLQACNLLLPLSMSFLVLFLQEIEHGAPLLNLRPHIRDGNVGIHSNRVSIAWICLEVPHVAGLEPPFGDHLVHGNFFILAPCSV